MLTSFIDGQQIKAFTIQNDAKLINMSRKTSDVFKSHFKATFDRNQSLKIVRGRMGMRGGF